MAVTLSPAFEAAVADSKKLTAKPSNDHLLVRTTPLSSLPDDDERN